MAGIVTIFIDGRGHAAEAALVSGSRLRELAGVPDDHPFALVREEGPLTPLSAPEVVLLNGGENFVATDTSGDAAADASGDTAADAAGDTATDTAGDAESSGPPVSVTPEFNGSRDVAVAGGKIAAEDLRKHDVEVASGRLFAVLGEDREEGAHVELVDGTTIVVQSTDSYFVVPHPEDAPGETAVDVEECTKYERRPPRWHRYRIRVDRAKFIVEKRMVSGAQVLGLVEKRPFDWALNQKLRGGRRIRIEAHEEVDLAEPGMERFETVRRQAQQG